MVVLSQTTRQAFITSEWTREPRLTNPLAALTAIQDSQDLPGNLVQVNEAEAEEIYDHYQAFAPTSQPLTMFWHGTTAGPGETCQRIKGSSHFTPIELVFKPLGKLSDAQASTAGQFP